MYTIVAKNRFNGEYMYTVMDDMYEDSVNDYLYALQRENNYNISYEKEVVDLTTLQRRYEEQRNVLISQD